MIRIMMMKIMRYNIKLDNNYTGNVNLDKNNKNCEKSIIITIES